ncbi:putative naringenin-chalcone synthase [Prosthecobacter fusiformis]|uniref:Putative naringenin-chalcone synthase n=1 Tax=Prosthecobacter fusiformis TaxID=48464 RepID=A0A4R7RLF0_9BACT|nr:type III polyketide synthase [Prosthecobacter fusiformis]TDU66171.1 putative naringenin-chalcone synthase [Prosthecobacter fusiformis]
MSSYIHHIATATPPYAYSQAYTRDRLKEWTQNPKTKRLIQAIYNRSGIETRHSVTGDFIAGADATLFRSDAEGRLIPPGTAERNRVYAHSARELSVEVAKRAIADAPGFAKEDITHIIYTSCTGFANPGPDYHVIRELGLRGNIQRYTLGFMGCYAAFPALRMAAQFCEADADAVVLVICLELCTLHMQVNDQPDSILANSLFADGAAAAIVSAREPTVKKPAYRLRGFESALLPSSEADMAWEIGNEGFNIVLSSYVPDIIGQNIRQLLKGILTRKGTSPEEMNEWAVHPGGRSILDKVQESLALPADTLEASRTILRDYGNMSSATILFVLKEMLDTADTDHANLCAMAFGPGLTVETALLERLGSTAMSTHALAENLKV